MRLRRLTVDGFAQLANIDIHFRDDAPNLIIGPNEAGKSHLMLAFYGMFFGVDKPERYEPWFGPSTMRGTLELVDGEERLVRLERALGNKDVTVSIDGELPWSGRISGKDGERFAGYLDEWLGFREKEIFTSTTFVRQAEVVRADMNGIAAEVKRLITGAMETNYEQARSDLEKDLDRLRKGPGKKTPRLLEQREEELRVLREQYEVAVQRQDAYSTLEKRREELRQEIAALMQNRERNEARLKRASGLIAAEGELAELTTRFTRLDNQRRQRQEIEARLAAAECTLQETGAGADLDAVTLTRLQDDLEDADTVVQALEPRVQALDAHPDALAEAERAVAGAEAEIEALRQRIPAGDLDPIALMQLDRAVEQAERDLERSDAQVAAGSMQSTWILAAVGAVFSILLAIAVHPAAVLLLAVAGFVAYQYMRRERPAPVEGDARARAAVDEARRNRAAVLARLGVTSVQEALELCRQFDALHERLAAARQRRSDILNALGVSDAAGILDLRNRYERACAARVAAERALADTFARLHVSSLDEALAARGRYEEAMGDRNTARAQLGMLPAAAELEAAWQRAGRDQAAKDMLVKDLLAGDVALQAHGSAEARAAYFERLQADVDAATRRLSELQSERESVERRIGMEGGTQDAPVLFLDIESVEGEIARLRQRIDATEIALATLKGAVDSFQGHSLDPVIAETSRLLTVITNGRYERVGLNGDTLEPTVDMAGKPGIPVAGLSRGVRDQLYFSLRVALARELAGRRALPIVLDDPFVNFDPERLERVIALLGEIAKSTQVILFTCDPQYVRWLQPVYELAAGVSVPSTTRAGEVA